MEGVENLQLYRNPGILPGTLTLGGGAEKGLECHNRARYLTVSLPPGSRETLFSC